MKHALARTSGIVLATAVVLGGCASSEALHELGASGTPVPSSSASESAAPTPAPTAAPQSPAPTSSPTPQASLALGDAPVAITIAEVHGANLEIAAHVDGLVEQGGTCTLTLERTDAASDAPVSVERDALPDAASTTCGRFAVPLGDLASGTWTATVTYASDTAYGVSDEVAVEVSA